MHGIMVRGRGSGAHRDARDHGKRVECKGVDDESEPGFPCARWCGCEV